MKLSQGFAVLGVVLVGALLFGAYSAASAPLPEGFPAPTADGEIDVKQYPAYRSATVQVKGDLGSASSRGFSPLFRHISNNDISMTAPVEAQYPAATLQTNAALQGDAAVSFLYGAFCITPRKGSIQIETVKTQDRIRV